MTRNSCKMVAVIVALCGLSSGAWADGRALNAGSAPLVDAPLDDLGALPSRARKSASPTITVKLKLEALRSESHPQLRTAVFAPQDIVRLVGEGFGSEAGGRSIVLSIAGSNLVLEVLSWSDKEIRVQVPDYDALGIDVRQGADAHAELSRTKKRVVGPSIEIGILSEEGKLVAKRTGQVVVAARDFDADGAEASFDCDDFDPRRAPNHAEVYDADGLDEDCNAETVAAVPPIPKGESGDALADLDL